MTEMRCTRAAHDVVAKHRAPREKVSAIRGVDENMQNQMSIPERESLICNDMCPIAGSKSRCKLQCSKQL